MASLDIDPEIRARLSQESLKGMSFIEHLEELRRRIVWSFIYIVAGFGVCYAFHERIFTFMQEPIMKSLKEHGLDQKLVYLNPIDPFNMYLKIAMVAGLFVASPFVLYQVWLFISPGLYKNERKYVMPFMFSTVGLFFAGGLFGYKIVYPTALNWLIGYSHQFTPMITISEYTSLFMTIIVGLGAVFEMPILIFFLALLGIVSPRWMWKNFQYAILVIFIIAGIITPTADVMNMCIFAAPMIVLYVISIGVAWFVHPKNRRKRQEAREERQG
jgi:sec-independent protein translocase protein TatC